MTNLDSIFKSGDITLPTKVRQKNIVKANRDITLPTKVRQNNIVKAMVFPVCMDVRVGL